MSEAQKRSAVSVNRESQLESLNVECRHLVMGNMKVLDIPRRKLIVGSRDNATKLLSSTLIRSLLYARSTTGEITRRNVRRCFSLSNLTAKRYSYVGSVRVLCLGEAVYADLTAKRYSYVGLVRGLCLCGAAAVFTPV